MPLDDPQFLTRRATLAPASLDTEAGTVEATITTFAPVQRRGFVERLDPAGLDTSGLIGAPVLDGHRQGSARDVIGAVEAVREEGQALVATIRLSAAPDVASTVQKIREGTIRGVSVGYAVSRWAESTDPQTRARVKTATAWRIREVSAVPIPADPGSQFRSHEMEQDEITITPERGALIGQCRAAYPTLSDEWATRMAESGDVLSDDEVKESAREEALAARQTRTAPATIRTAKPANDDPVVTRDRQAEALACRMSGEVPSDAARPFMALGLDDLARDALTRSGERIGMMGREEVMTRAMHGTSDFPELLTGAGNRVLSNAYRQAETVLKRLARQRTASDFRALSILGLGEFSGLSKVSEHGEIKSMSTAETKEGYSLETFGGMFSLTRKALINDDLGAFGRWGEMMGRAAAETEAEQLLGLLSANSGLGVTLSDGKTLFHADHGNLAGTGTSLGSVGDDEMLANARKAMRVQTGLDGSTPVNVVPKFLLVGPELEDAAERILATIYATTFSDVNPNSGRLTLLVEPRITGGEWYLFADPAAAPVLEYAYLSSAPGPQLASRDGWETLGREFRVVLDFGCGAVDHRGAYLNEGDA